VDACAHGERPPYACRCLELPIKGTRGRCGLLDLRRVRGLERTLWAGAPRRAHPVMIMAHASRSPVHVILPLGHERGRVHETLLIRGMIIPRCSSLTPPHDMPYAHHSQKLVLTSHPRSKTIVLTDHD
jgi:hypothetical protein